MRLRRRARGDAQPTTRCRVLLASDGTRAFSRSAIAEAATCAGSEPVAVLTIARIHGSSLGLPNPGLMPTKQELADRREWVRDAIAGLRRAGVAEADGQVAATRRHARMIARVARLREVEAVVIDETAATGLRRVVEGDVGSAVRRRLRRHGVEVRIVPAASAEPARLRRPAPKV